MKALFVFEQEEGEVNQLLSRRAEVKEPEDVKHRQRKGMKRINVTKIKEDGEKRSRAREKSKKEGPL